MFAACTTITLGHGSKAKFWSDGWMQGCRPKDLAPNLFKITTRKKITVQTALTVNSWFSDIPLQHILTTTHLAEFVALWNRLQNVQLQPNQEDQISWKLTPSAQYSAASAYKAQFLGCTKARLLTYLWNSWAPPKCMLFIWLVTQNRVWNLTACKKGDVHTPVLPPLSLCP